VLCFGQPFATTRLQRFCARDSRLRGVPAERDEHQVAYGIVHQFPGGTKEQYEASIGANDFQPNPHIGLKVVPLMNR
jgi:hypothetical protein